MKKSVRKGGFTLPEVLVTVTVVAVLAAVVVPAVTQYVTKGDAPSTKQDIQALQNGISAFTADVRKYPGAITQLTTAITNSDSTASDGYVFSTSDVALWKGPYFSGAVTNGTGYTSSGLGLTINDTIRMVSNWLQDSITAPTTCPALLRVDTLIDNADGGTAGQIVWSGTCAQGTPAGTMTGRALRITPVGK